MMNDIFLKIDSGENLLFHGPGGTGKTYAIREIVKRYPDKKIMVMAPTGKAAVALEMNATTIHRGLYIPLISKTTKVRDMRSIAENDRSKMPDHIDMIIVDEISMVGCKLLTMMDMILRKLYEEKKVMGGVQIIFCGDFYQLKPVKDNYCHKSKVWSKLNLQLVRFDQSQRFAGCETFDFLGRLRFNQLTFGDKDLLSARKLAFINREYEDLGYVPTTLCVLNDTTIEINNGGLEKIKENNIKIRAHDKLEEYGRHDGYDEIVHRQMYGEIINVPPDLTDQKMMSYVMKKIAPENISFKIGAKIIFTKNINHKEKLVNGMTGTVVEYEKDIVTVRIEDRSLHHITMHEYVARTRRHIIRRRQYPFKLGWAITIHKSQGSTLSAAVIQIDNAFDAGQVYVAMSRVIDINRIYIKGEINYPRIFCNTDLPPEIL